MRNMLITGGAGFIGANLVHYWMAHYPDDVITVLDALTYAGNKESVKQYLKNKNFNFIHGDICDSALVNEIFNSGRIDTVVHLAAESHVDRSIIGPDTFVQTNIIGTHTLLKIALENWNKNGILSSSRFHHVSTDEVYGSLGESEAAFKETTAYDPRSPYSASKAASDHLVRAYHHTYGMNVTISNCSNNYGPYHFPEKLIPLAILNILHGKAVPVYGDGNNIRDWLYVEDHCRALDLILGNGRTGETYNIGGHSEHKNIDVVTRICNLVDSILAASEEYRKKFPNSPPANKKTSTSLIKFVKDRAGHDWRYAMNISKINSELGFLPVESFDTGLQKTIHWYLDHQDWWEPLIGEVYREWIKTNYG